jgi:predicted nucleic acid-binding protein
MKVFFDTNVYVAEALRGAAASRALQATARASWRIYVNDHVVEELEDVIRRLGLSNKVASLSSSRVLRRATLVGAPSSRHTVPDDPDDSPIVSAALTAAVDYLVTNQEHLLELNPYKEARDRHGRTIPSTLGKSRMLA